MAKRSPLCRIILCKPELIRNRHNSHSRAAKLLFQSSAQQKINMYSACYAKERSSLFLLCPKVIVKMEYVQLLIALSNSKIFISINLFPSPFDILQDNFCTPAARIRGDPNFRGTNSTLYDGVLDTSRLITDYLISNSGPHTIVSPTDCSFRRQGIRVPRVHVLPLVRECRIFPKSIIPPWSRTQDRNAYYAFPDHVSGISPTCFIAVTDV